MRDRAGLLVQLWDPSPALPRARAVRELTLGELDATTAEAWNEGGGWGLPIVRALSADCGYRPSPPAGKWVWARLARP
ncbi:hypothetical protein [Actinocorallia longicatena]|uniref:ATP-binding protein n=1 Tax=Actinocorallia longicatena TaxID=111803 RepID=A0ABP6QB45_9ACTN